MLCHGGWPIVFEPFVVRIGNLCDFCNICGTSPEAYFVAAYSSIGVNLFLCTSKTLSYGFVTNAIGEFFFQSVTFHLFTKFIVIFCCVVIFAVELS